MQGYLMLPQLLLVLVKDVWWKGGLGRSRGAADGLRQVGRKGAAGELRRRSGRRRWRWGNDELGTRSGRRRRWGDGEVRTRSGRRRRWGDDEVRTRSGRRRRWGDDEVRTRSGRRRRWGDSELGLRDRGRRRKGDDGYR
jgi:hypothetical protein